MHCTELPCPRRASASAVALLLALAASGCSQAPDPAPPAAAPVAPGVRGTAAGASPGRPGDAPTSPSAAAAAAPQRRGPLPDWDGYRRQAAARIVALNPGATYAGAVPEPLLAIPVLEIELERDGSLRRISVLRQPGQAPDTVQLAIAAVRRAAPFGSVAHLPRPWKYTETFLFDDQRRFKPRSLDV